MQLCQSEWTVLQSLWERQPQTLMQLVENLSSAPDGRPARARPWPAA